MSIFINGIGAITPQNNYPSDSFLDDVNVFDSGRLSVVEPDYSKFIGPVPLRRMSKIIKMGLSSALMCLNDADIKKPEAIITATGLGCVEDTDKFLNNMTDDDENFLNPTPFIQSTHNAVAARVAIETACNDYNMTYVHKNTAFEQALLDSFLKIKSKKYNNILIGGTEELTDENYNLKKNVEFWKDPIKNSDLLKYKNTKGCIPGEGSVFFLLSSQKSNNAYAEIKATKTIYKIKTSFKQEIEKILNFAHILLDDVDVVLFGLNGNVEEDFIYDNIKNELPGDISLAYYKHLCGEYETSSGFAMLVAAHILKTQKIPQSIKLNDKFVGNIKNILIYQQRNNTNHSFTVLSKC